MTGRAVAALVAGILGLLLVTAAGGTALIDGGLAACGAPVTLTSSVVTPSSAGWPRIGHYSPSQVGLAATIVTVGARLGVPTRGWVIGIAVALQESDLSNPWEGDRDSVGLLQQRPSQGWGTPQQLHDPVYASRKFFAALLAVPSWQQLPLTDVAQAVQHSAYPDAYTKWEPDATMLATALSAHLQGGSPASNRPGCQPTAGVLARAATWLTAWNDGPVPYLSSDDPATWLHGYRRDCSGYASMALGLPRPGLDTGGIAARSTPIGKTDLRAGDLLINPAPDNAGHVVIFDRWTNSSMSSYLGYEQSGDGGTHHRTIPYPYFGSYPINPYRFVG
jgi:hypothetical protein